GRSFIPGILQSPDMAYQPGDLGEELKITAYRLGLLPPLYNLLLAGHLVKYGIQLDAVKMLDIFVQEFSFLRFLRIDHSYPFFAAPLGTSYIDLRLVCRLFIQYGFGQIRIGR